MKSWADGAIKDLARNGTAKIRPKGHSMKGKVESGDEVELSVCKPEELSVGNVVLVKVKGRIYLHLIKAIKNMKGRLKFQIGNNYGGINGWVGPNAVYGVMKEGTKNGNK